MKKKTEKEENIKKKCFVVGPISDAGSDTRINADWVLDGIVKPILEKRGYTIERADGISTPGNIDTQVINAVIEADLVVADLSEHNANAFYELGLRHMSPGKPVIHMIRKGEKIPFDNTAFRTIVFDHSSHKGLEQAKRDLEAQVVETEKDDFKVETPVSRARTVQKIKFEGSDFEKTVQLEIQEIKRQLNNTKVVRDIKLSIVEDDHVYHAKFGAGRVLEIVDGNKVVVRFDDGVVRKVMENFVSVIPF
ncbi:MAG: hypothetical protein OQJ97_01775 [Rhodospirillales bacterium]|nr:hypothetical protein [Rhodospirillales bacterium]